MSSRNFPQNIRMDSILKEKYLDTVVRDPQSVYYKRELGEAYLMAASIGLSTGTFIESKVSREVRVYVTLSEQSKLLIDVIAASGSKYDFDALLDGARVLKIVEGYANGGAQLMHQKATNSIASEIDKDIWEIANSLHPAA